MTASAFMMTIDTCVNGISMQCQVRTRQHLADFVRDELGLTGTHLGCEHGVCGSCSIVVDGAVVRGCLMLATQADGARIDTIEGLSESGALASLQAEFGARNAAQCGYCTSGMLLTALEITKHHKHATRDEIRELISGNYCRCTGYQAIVNAVESVLVKSASESGVKV